MLGRIRTMQDKVKSILIKYPETRDDDNLLVVKLWWHSLNDSNIDAAEQTSLEFLHMYKLGQIPTADIITRARRKVQEENKDLRGESWEERHKEAKNIAQEINQ